MNLQLVMNVLKHQKDLGFEWKKGPRKNGWNNNDCNQTILNVFGEKKRYEDSRNVCVRIKKAIKDYFIMKNVVVWKIMKQMV